MDFSLQLVYPPTVNARARGDAVMKQMQLVSLAPGPSRTSSSQSFQISEFKQTLLCSNAKQNSHDRAVPGPSPM